MAMSAAWKSDTEAYSDRPPVAPSPHTNTPSSVLDLVHLTRQTFGDPDLEREVLLLFAGQADATVVALQSAGTGTERARLFHMLKGSARGIGAFQLANMAEAGEEAPDCLDHVRRVSDDVASLGAHINRLLGSASTS